ncbi:hypothetical protein RHABOEDO_000561 [Candidatus Rhabdochlamydia oedothoracis]|uniref:Uncharacterized protein n=1 Tax=Candidatus Rhabdochlamydia oedothoracis TaxID=2720720 RepID=A0ABX8UZM0_9BACT|nr:MULTISPECIES: hypothetical protein [Rhabdochlamydia]KAG6559559.1 hypothetical protein RHOW815_000431 [Candidatus Rhabdochlamydia sp. W815]QYF48405.1 hypothetical protein RHABOEDO_000561 [Candidatus Rhabdochlamydia oedothoracis]
MDLKIGSFFSAACTATTTVASSVYGFGKDILSKGCSVCSSLTGKVGQVAGRFIPTAVSNTVQAYPKTFSFVTGVGVTVAVGSVVCRFFAKSDGAHPKDPGINMHETNVTSDGDLLVSSGYKV